MSNFYIYVFLFNLTFYPVAQASLPACQPFRVYLKAILPKPFGQDNLGPIPINWEKLLVDNITEYETNFDKYYWRWRLSDQAKHLVIDPKWLQCILYYVRMDTDDDGVPDWTALVDEKPSHILYPFDPDMDGDGIENMLDLKPLKKSPAPLNKNTFPMHLMSSNKSVLYWQNKLWRQFRMLAIEHTADHSPYVLRELFLLLQNAFPSGPPNWLRKIKYIYAFRKHDDVNDIAAYHQSLHAISIGGSIFYTKKFIGQKKIRLLSTIAHELGHAFLLESIGPGEFQALCESFGWKDVFGAEKLNSLYAGPFFRDHPEFNSVNEAYLNNFVSEYSFTNAHEWFAESFAATIMMRLGLNTTKNSKRFNKWLTNRLDSM